MTSYPEIENNQCTLRLLVVDDCPIQRQLSAVYGRMLDFHVDVATTGYEATVACARNTYDIVLMDCDMPVMDGVEATRRIRADDKARAGAPVLIVAFTASENEEKCLEGGMDHFISKSRSERLLNLLERLKTEICERKAS